MALCSTCGAERGAPSTSCGKCGAAAERVPELELDVRPRAAPPPPSAVAAPEATAIDLAFDPHGLEPPSTRSVVRTAAALPSSVLTDHEVSDAWLLADYGHPPTGWLKSPFYALRVLRRRHEIKHTLTLRVAEAGRAAVDLENALVVLAERVRAAAEKVPAYAEALDSLQRAEQVLGSRDRVLADEHHEQAARLASIDARLAKLEAELAQVRAEEREAAAALVSLQDALVREESNLKRSETELRAAEQRGATGTRP